MRRQLKTLQYLSSYIQVEGTLQVDGTYEEPVDLFPSSGLTSI